MENNNILAWWEPITKDTNPIVVINTLNDFARINGINTAKVPFVELLTTYNKCVKEACADAQEAYEETIWSLRWQY